MPSAGNRRALLLKGDIDITYTLPPKDFSEVAKQGGNVKVNSLPIENAIWYLGMLTSKPPFNNPALRRAIAHALEQAELTGDLSAAWSNADWRISGRLSRFDSTVRVFNFGGGFAFSQNFTRHRSPNTASCSN